MLLASLTWTILGWTGGILAILLLLALLGWLMSETGDQDFCSWYFFTLPAMRAICQLIVVILAALFRGGSGGGGGSE